MYEVKNIYFIYSCIDHFVTKMTVTHFYDHNLSAVTSFSKKKQIFSTFVDG